MDQDDEPQSNLRKVGVFITIPFVLAVPPVLGWAIGHWLDKYFGTDPYLMYIFVILGFASAIREFCRIITKFGSEL